MICIVQRAAVLGVIAAEALSAQALPTFVTSIQLTIGDTTSGTATYLTRLSDARRLSDGRIAVAVCGSSEVRSFDAAGRHVGTVTLSASPMPQRSLMRLFPAGGDTLAAYEAINTRLTLIAPDLSVLRTVPVPNPLPPRPDGLVAPSPLDVIGRFADGTFLGRMQGSPPTEAGVQRRKLAFYRFDDAGRMRDSLGGLPGAEAIVVPNASTGGTLRLARTTTVAFFPDRFVVGDQAVAEVAEYGPDFRQLRRTPTITKPLPVTDSVRAAWVVVASSRANFPVNGVTPVYIDAYAAALPAFRDLVAGVDGRLWVQDPVGAGSYPLTWTAYQSARPVARAELPPRFYPTQFGSDWILGLAFDSTRAPTPSTAVPERVQLLRLTPGAISGRELTPRDAAPTNRPRCGAWTSR